MIVAFPTDVISRLAAIEAVEGVPALDFVHEAVRVWSALDLVERRLLQLTALDLIAGRQRH